MNFWSVCCSSCKKCFCCKTNNEEKEGYSVLFGLLSFIIHFLLAPAIIFSSSNDRTVYYCQETKLWYILYYWFLVNLVSPFAKMFFTGIFFFNDEIISDIKKYIFMFFTYAYCLTICLINACFIYLICLELDNYECFRKVSVGKRSVGMSFLTIMYLLYSVIIIIGLLYFFIKSLFGKVSKDDFICYFNTCSGFTYGLIWLISIIFLIGFGFFITVGAMAIGIVSMNLNHRIYYFLACLITNHAFLALYLIAFIIMDGILYHAETRDERIYLIDNFNNFISKLKYIYIPVACCINIYLLYWGFNLIIQHNNTQTYVALSANLAYSITFVLIFIGTKLNKELFGNIKLFDDTFDIESLERRYANMNNNHDRHNHRHRTASINV
jgi:hypothetical protein